MSRWLGFVFQDKDEITAELNRLILIKIFANGSLSKHEIAELIRAEYNIERAKIEGAIAELISL